MHCECKLACERLSFFFEVENMVRPETCFPLSVVAVVVSRFATDCSMFVHYVSLLIVVSINRIVVTLDVVDVHFIALCILCVVWPLTTFHVLHNLF